MASYKVLLKKSVEKDLRKIDRTVIPRIIQNIQSLAENPVPMGSRKLVGSDKTYRLRVGDYRVVYQINDDLLEVEVQHIAHRKHVYR